MKNSPSAIALAAIIGSLAVAGCELETLTPDAAPLRRAKTVVINEVFTLPADYPTAYSWIEFLNPTGDTVNLSGWTLSFYTERLIVYNIEGRDSSGNLIFRIENAEGAVDSVGVFDASLVGQRENRVLLPPNGLLTVVNDEDRMLDHINWGPGDSRFEQEKRNFLGSVISADTIPFSADTFLVFISREAFRFSIRPKDQLVLKDSTGKIVDVVRMGDSVYTNVFQDSAYTIALLRSSNRSVGPVPLFESVARYAGGYFTGNTRSDFYITRPGLTPIPQWYSQLPK